MTWSTLPTYTNGTLTAAQLMAIRDNINETAAAKATTAGYHFVANGPTTLVERAIVSARVSAQETTTLTGYGNIPSGTVGPTVTATTGAKALVWFAAQMFHQTTGSCWSSFEVTGASSVASGDDRAITCEAAEPTQSFRFSSAELQTVTPGSNTFRQQYRVGASGGTGTFDDRHLIAMAL